MAIMLKCPDCGHTEESEDGASMTCPECEGTMAAPAKKKYQAKSTSLEEESRAKKKKHGDDDEDEEEEKPKKKKKKSSDDDDDEKGEGYILDPGPAESLELDPGFDNKRLMKQVCAELSRGETCYWAGRMCKEIAAQKAQMAMIAGIGIGLAGLLFCGIFFAVAPWFVGLIPIIFVVVGIAIAIFGPKGVRNSAENGWYALTDRRAVVYTASMFGSGGDSTSYQPGEVRFMRIKPAKRPKGAGDLIFKTKITEHRTRYVDRRTGRTTRTETNRTETHYGFLGIKDVRDVETLIHKVLLKTIDDDDDDDEGEDEKPRKKKSRADDDDDDDEPKSKKKSRDDDDDEDERLKKKKKPRDDDDD